MSDESEIMTIEQLNEYVLDQQSAINGFFLFVVGTIVLMMQTGFAFQEAGLVNEKNVVNILIKNLLDACVGAILYWTTGYALAYGEASGDSYTFCGSTKWLLIDVPTSEFADFFFQYTFAATAATIVSGTLAERVSFYGYLIYSAVLCGFIYPIVTHWGWTSTGILTTLGYSDFAGSGLVHLVGGVAAAVGALILGGRTGRYEFQIGANGRRQRIIHSLPKHSIPFALLGTFILFFGFLAFNGGSQLAVTPMENAIVVMQAVVNTVIAGSAGATSGLLYSAILSKFKIWSIMSTSCGCLGGLVSICASANVVEFWAACVIGLMGGVISCILADNLPKIGIDDPVDAVSIHAGCGIWGTLCVGLFSTSAGAFYGHGGEQLQWQVVGILIIATWTIATMTPTFFLMKLAGILRVPLEKEIHGLDEKHGETAYNLDKTIKEGIEKSIREVSIELGSLNPDVIGTSDLKMVNYKPETYQNLTKQVEQATNDMDSGSGNGHKIGDTSSAEDMANNLLKDEMDGVDGSQISDPRGATEQV